MQPDRQVGARPAVAQVGEAPRVQRLLRGSRAARCARATPRPDRARRGARRGRPPARAVRRPARRTRSAPSPAIRVRDDRPVAEPVGERERRLCDLAHPCLADTRAVEIREQLRLRVAGDRAERAAGLAERPQALDEPGRREAELLLAGLLDVRATNVLVAVEHVHVLRAGLVRLARDRPRERRMLDQRVDAERLPGLQIQADLDGQARVLLESLVGHGGER